MIPSENIRVKSFTDIFAIYRFWPCVIKRLSSLEWCLDIAKQPSICRGLSRTLVPLCKKPGFVQCAFTDSEIWQSWGLWKKEVRKNVSLLVLHVRVSFKTGSRAEVEPGGIRDDYARSSKPCIIHSSQVRSGERKPWLQWSWRASFWSAPNRKRKPHL